MNANVGMFGVRVCMYVCVFFFVCVCLCLYVCVRLYMNICVEMWKIYVVGRRCGRDSLPAVALILLVLTKECVRQDIWRITHEQCGKDVQEMMHGWVTSEGYPLVEVSVCEDSHLRFSQSRISGRTVLRLCHKPCHVLC